jgi:DNA repair exonuclease SbcCD nuclease subunit
MKIGLITDTHYNFRKANKAFHEYFEKFYNDIFFPTLKKNKIKTVVHLGDAFDNRKGVDYWALQWAKKNVYDKFEELGITVYSIVGNHDAYYKNTNEVNSIDVLLNEYSNIVKVSSPIETYIDDTKCVFLPWICTENEKETFSLLEESTAKVLFGHLELSGFSVYPGHVQENGLSKNIFQKFDRVFSGHYHTRSDDGKIFYLGNPYQMFWSDVNDKRGFHIFDTDDYTLQRIENPYTMFEKVYYDDECEDIDFSSLTNKMIKLFIQKKENHLKFDKFVSQIANANPLEFKIVENFDIYDDDVNSDEFCVEDTLSILDKYVEESEFNLNKTVIKNLLRDVYKEALEVE